MQLRQKYTINNIIYENEMFISEKDNVNIIGAIEYFFNIPNTDKKIEVASIREKDEQPAKTEEKSATDENNNTVVTIPVEHEEKETDVNVNATKKETDEADTPGFYLHLVLGENNIEKWGPWKSKKAAKQALYDMVYRRKKQTGYDVKYSVIELRPMTEKEFKNRNK